MKKLIFLVMFLFPAVAFAQLSNYYTSGKTKVTEIKESFVGNKQCPVYSDTPMSMVTRPNLELDFRLGVLDSPSGGSFTLTTDNYDIVVKHFLSASLYVYGWYGIRTYSKPSYEWSNYEERWDSRSAFAGAGIYLTPTISIFGGTGVIWLNNENGDAPELDTPFERGISIDFPISKENLWKLIASYRFIEAQLAKNEDTDLPPEELQGDGSYSVVSLSFSVPINW